MRYVRRFGTASYYKVMHFTPDCDFRYGIFIDHVNENFCHTKPWCADTGGQPIAHGWARLVTGAALEIYPYGDGCTYNPYVCNIGGVRIDINGFPEEALGGRFSRMSATWDFPY
jgi:hypothetical protein